MVKRQHFRCLNEYESAKDTFETLAGNIHSPRFTQADSDKNRVEIIFQLGKAHIVTNFRILASFDA